MNINVSNIDGFVTLVNTLQRLVSGAKFVVTPSGVQVNSINDNKTVRAFLRSTCATAEKDVEFCFTDLLKLNKALQLVRAVGGKNECTLGCTGAFLTHEGDASFKLKLVKAEIVEKNITQELKTELAEVFSVRTSSERMRTIVQNLSIADDDESKVYMYVKNKRMIVELDDKTNPMTNSVSVPFASEFEGDASKVVVVSFGGFKTFNVLQSDTIRIAFTTANVFVVDTESTDGSGIKLRMICAALKG